MRADLKEFYERELQFLYAQGAEFAQANRRIASRLALDVSPCPDPYVERLLEGIAFLTARIQMKLDARHPEFTQHLLELLYPQFLSPVPSCAIAEIVPDLTEGSLVGGVRVPRGSRLSTVLGKGEQTACEYRTAHDVTLWPLSVTDAKYFSSAGALSALGVATGPAVKGAIRLTLRATGVAKLAQLPLTALTFHLVGAAGLAASLYEQVIGNAVGFCVRPAGSSGSAVFRTACSLAAAGVDGDDAMLPVSRRGFDGYRHLQEYFALPERFLFFTLGDLQGVLKDLPGQEMEVFILLNRLNSRLDRTLEPGQFRLNCTPVVNLFHRVLDRVEVTPTQTELHLVADRNRPMDFEIHSIERVAGAGTGGERLMDLAPMYSVSHGTQRDTTRTFYTAQRRPRLLSTRQQQSGERTSYMGSELFLSVSDSAGRHMSGEIRHLDVEALCTNRDLPLQSAFGIGTTDFVLESGAPVASVRCIQGPTNPREAPGFGRTAWSLISHLSLNTLSLQDRNAEDAAGFLRKLLSLYVDPNSRAMERQVEGIRAVSYQPVVRRIPVAGPISYGRGLGISVAVDDAAFEETGPMVLGTVLDRFFARYVSVNSFIQLTLRSVTRGELKTWPIRLGLRDVL